MSGKDTSAAVERSPFNADGLRPVQWTVADWQLLVTGLAQVAAGVKLLVDPLALFQIPIIVSILGHLQRTINLPAFSPQEQDTSTLTLVGAFLIFTGYNLLMTLYTVDEKAMHNSVSARAFLAMALAYVCKNTAFGTTAHALLALFMAVPAILLGLTVGFGDGNVVDIRESQEFDERTQRAKKE